ncbi:alpha/beta hydrolase [Marinicauda pacifica]|uniref:alpha/beta hydrolase n=1 Tax=Marinicauda pacifica TaxID=1133559 RepID=UPI0035C87D09
MTARHSHPAGRVERLVIESGLLKDNFLGDPARRAIDVWVPHGSDGAGLPLLVSLAGYTSSGLAHTAWKNFGENLPERLDRLYGEGRIGPCVVAFPDTFTRLGGNQFINSSVMGPWEDILIEEMVPAVEAAFRCGGPGKRGVFGKSSGGYGAIVHAMLHSDFWSGAACHAGDMGFDIAYLRMMPATLRQVAKAGTISDFFERFEASDRVRGEDIEALMILAMGATYDPAPEEPYGIRLPVTHDTCELIADRWANWLAWDPLEMVGQHAASLNAMKALFIDCGRQDQYDFLYPARRMKARLDDLGVEHRYEEFEGTHSGIDFRLEVSLPWLVERLA